MNPTRRSCLAGLGAVGLSSLVPGWAMASTGSDERLVVLILRGALDGLAAVPPFGDRAYESARGEVAVERPGRSERSALDLDGFFGLHRSLAPVFPWFEEGSLGILHAAALPYRERSHFDAQNILENGTSAAFALDSGWLNRAVAALDGQLGTAMALSRTVPLILRGEAPVTSADPLRSWMPRDVFLDRVADLYAADPYLGPALESALATQELLDEHRDDSMGGGRSSRRGPQLGAAASTVGALMGAPDGPRVAVAEIGGWDTHANQQGTLDRLLGELAEALVGLREGLGEAWGHTAVLVVTEFGRTVHANGSGGTDHGTGSVALVAGGAISGGTVWGGWPGLDRRQLYQGRDLAPTTDLRSLFKGLLRDHLGLTEAVLEDAVFPESRLAVPLDGVVRS